METVVHGNSCKLDKRGCIRIPLGLQAEIISRNESFHAVIVNASPNGMCIRVPHESNNHFLKSDTHITLKLYTPYRTIIHLHCRQKWSYKITPASLIENIGLELIDPPDHYNIFYKLLPLNGEKGR